MLRHQFFADEKVRRCSFVARLLFCGLWCYADNHGRMEYRPAQIKAAVFPCDPGLDREPPPDLHELIQELVQAGLVMRYADQGNEYLCIPGFSKHQKLRRLGDSKYPAPKLPGNSRQVLDTPDGSDEFQTTPVNSGQLHDHIAEVERKIKEKGMDGEEKGESDRHGNMSKQGSPRSGTLDRAETPVGLSQLEYARELLEGLGMPVMGNLLIVADCIVSLSKSAKINLSSAFEQIRTAAQAQRLNGVKITQFWFKDAGYITVTKARAIDLGDENRVQAEKYKSEKILKEY